MLPGETDGISKVGLLRGLHYRSSYQALTVQGTSAAPSTPNYCKKLRTLFSLVLKEASFIQIIVNLRFRAKIDQ